MGDIGLTEKRRPSKSQRFRPVLLTSRKGRSAGLRPSERPFHKGRQLPTGFHIEPNYLGGIKSKYLFSHPSRCRWPPGKGAGLRPTPFPENKQHLQGWLNSCKSSYSSFRRGCASANNREVGLTDCLPTSQEPVTFRRQTPHFMTTG